MAVTPNSVVTPQTWNRGVVKFVGTTDAPSTLKTLYVSGANGSKVAAINGVNAGATLHLITLMLVNSGTTYELNSVNLAAQVGNNGTLAPTSLTSPTVWPGLAVDGNGNPYLALISGDTLEAEYATAQTTAENISLYCVGQDL